MALRHCKGHLGYVEVSIICQYVAVPSLCPKNSVPSIHLEEALPLCLPTCHSLDFASVSVCRLATSQRILSDLRHRNNPTLAIKAVPVDRRLPKCETDRFSLRRHPRKAGYLRNARSPPHALRLLREHHDQMPDVGIDCSPSDGYANKLKIAKRYYGCIAADHTERDIPARRATCGTARWRASRAR